MKSNITYWWCVSNWHLCTAEALWSCYRGSSLGQIEPGARVTGTFSEFSRIIHSGETVRSWTPHLMPWSCVWECVRLKERESVWDWYVFGNKCVYSYFSTDLSPWFSGWILLIIFLYADITDHPAFLYVCVCLFCTNLSSCHDVLPCLYSLYNTFHTLKQCIL